jgi:hypothetical protein
VQYSDVALAANAMAEEIAPARQTGTNDHLSNPVERALRSMSASRLASRSRSQRANRSITGR